MKAMASARLALLLIGLWTVNSVTAQPTSRILGGEEAAKDGFPYVSSVRLDGTHICGGSIIGVKSILTAAHCLFENGKEIIPSRLDVRVGSVNQFAGGKLAYVSSIVVHPNYAGVKNDIAILTLSSELVFTDRIRSIQIAESNTDEPAAGASVTVAGWGEQISSESAYKLHSLKLTVDNEENCLNAYADSDDSTICLAHNLKEGSCYGDAGNGATYNGKLVGVSDFVVGACGSRYPDVFSNVAYYAAWITSTVA